MNANKGETIFIRLRPAHDKNSFLSIEEWLVGTLLHEFTHNVHGPHDKHFYEFLDKLEDEYGVLRAGGYSGEGFLSEGKKAGTTSHNLPAHLARDKAVKEAERRQQVAKIMGPSGGSRLGPTGRSSAGKTPKQMAAEAAERRAQDAKGCGNGEAVSDSTVEEEMAKAKKESTTLDHNAGSVVTGNSTAGPSRQRSNGNKDKSKDTEDNSDTDDSDIEIIDQPKTDLPNQKNAKTGLASTSSRKHQLPPAKVPERAKVSKRDASTWNCQICTFENSKTMALACEMCGSERDPASIAIVAAKRTHNATAAPSLPQYDNTAFWWVFKVEGENVRKADGCLVLYRTCHLCGAETEKQWWTCRLCGHMKQAS
jgi:hypothetical protein